VVYVVCVRVWCDVCVWCAQRVAPHEETPIDTATATATSTSTATSTTPPLEIGEWRHPEPGDVRGPCPILNTLANHGYIHRNGKNITAGSLIDVMEDILNFSFDVAAALTGLSTVLFKTTHFNLDELNLHNAIEHDASLTRLDMAQGNNLDLSPELLEQFIKSSSDGKVLTMTDIGAYRKHRQEDCKIQNPGCDFGIKAVIAGALEPASLLCTFGNKTDTGDYVIGVDRVESIFGHEKLPGNWHKPTNQVTFGCLMPAALEIRQKWQ